MPIQSSMQEEKTEADAQEERTRRDRRRLLRGLGGIGAVFLIALGVIVYSDAPPPDLADLAFEPVVVADADNLYLVLVKRGEAMKAAP
ncbi:MAG: hypothetical protein H7067_17670, partial [Burkholderiales bacterium]|nr:hypothetical protein [Opitutaceae bacterium]